MIGLGCEMDKENVPFLNDSQPVPKRKFRDSVFTSLFREKKYLLELYKALHPEDVYAREDDITDVTIVNVLTDNRYNDLGFRVGDRLMILVEAQVKWSVNIIIRLMMYLMQSYNQYFTENKADLYSSTKVKLPKPELYMLFLGDRKEKPEYITFSGEFFGGQETAIDAKIKVIYDGQEGDIINQYVLFTRIFAEQVKLHGKTRKAVEETLRICKDRNVLREYLESRKKEVVDIMFALYDEEEILERYVYNKVNEAVNEAELENSKKIAKNMLQNGKMTNEEIAMCTGLSLKEVEQLQNQQ